MKATRFSLSVTGGGGGGCYAKDAYTVQLARQGGSRYRRWHRGKCVPTIKK